MKTTIKNILIPVISSMIISGTAIGQTNANPKTQTPAATTEANKKETVHIKIVKNENGKTIMIDTILTNPSESDLQKFEIEIPDVPEVPNVDDVPPVPPAPGSPKLKRKKIIIHTDKNTGDTLIINETGDMDKELKETGIEMNEGDGKKVIVIKDIAVAQDGDKENKTVKVLVKTIMLKDPSKEERKLQSKNSSSENTLNVERLNFFPNPNNGKFNLTFALKEKGNTDISILNSEGKKVYEEKLKDFSGDYSRAIDLSGSPNGIYFLNVQQGKNNLVKKIIVE